MTGRSLSRPRPADRPPRFVWRLEPAHRARLPGREALRPAVGVPARREPAFFAGLGPEPFGAAVHRRLPPAGTGADARRHSSRSCSISVASPVSATSTRTRRCSGRGSIRCASRAASGRARRCACTRRCSRPCRPASTTKARRSRASWTRPANAAPSRRCSTSTSAPASPAACAARRSAHCRGRPRHALLPTVPAASRRHRADGPSPPQQRRAGARQATGLRRARRAVSGAGQNPLYIVLTWVPRRQTLAIGSLGDVVFERGWYAYVGSAKRAREARVARHLARDKPSATACGPTSGAPQGRRSLRWHADHLFAAVPARERLAHRHGAQRVRTSRRRRGCPARRRPRASAPATAPATAPRPSAQRPRRAAPPAAGDARGLRGAAPDEARPAPHLRAALLPLLQVGDLGEGLARLDLAAQAVLLLEHVHGAVGELHGLCLGQDDDAVVVAHDPVARADPPARRSAWGR